MIVNILVTIIRYSYCYYWLFKAHENLVSNKLQYFFIAISEISIDYIAIYSIYSPLFYLSTRIQSADNGALKMKRKQK